MEIDYNGYDIGLSELEYLRKVTMLSPIAAIKINGLRRDGKERQANALEYERRFKFYMKLCEKDWHYYDRNAEQSLSQFAHDVLGRAYYAWKESSQERGR